jgi:hypothetical protein
MRGIEKFIKRTNNWAVPVYDILPAYCFPERQLRFQVYCVGMEKTGTFSMHITFHQHYRSAHEPEFRFLTYKILAFVNGKIDKSELTRYVKQRERRLGLEMDSSCLNYFLIDILVKEFSEAKFILTIRDCYSWLNSLINHYATYPQLRNWLRHYWVRFDKFRFKADRFQHTKPEKILADNKLETLDGYFSYWAEYNSKILATVPKDRLFVVKTSEINQNIEKMEEFLEIIPGTLPTHVHTNVGKQKINLLSKIDPKFLEEKANFHCKELMDKYFPEIKGFKDVQ